MSGLPPVDAHAHVAVTVEPHQVRALNALVIAVTSGAGEWDAVRRRRDELTLWAAGCHPNDRSALAKFDVDHFSEAIEALPAVGEVGLDGGGSTDPKIQLTVFRSVLAAVAARPRPITIHSRFASDAVLDCLEAWPQAAPILHWWRGDEAQTRRAIDLGCYFSLNGAEVAKPRVLRILPPERVLTETDYPHTMNADPAADRPAAVRTIEDALGLAWGMSCGDVRTRVWANLAEAFERAESLDRLPSRWVQMTLAITGDVDVARRRASEAPL